MARAVFGHQRLHKGQKKKKETNYCVDKCHYEDDTAVYEGRRVTLGSKRMGKDTSYTEDLASPEVTHCW
jgi:hypothetical protein